MATAKILNKETNIQEEIRDGLSEALRDWTTMQISAIRNAAQDIIPEIGADSELLKSAGMLTYASMPESENFLKTLQ